MSNVINRNCTTGGKRKQKECISEGFSLCVSCDKMPEYINLQKKRGSSAPGFRGFSTVVTWLHCFWSFVGVKHHKKGFGGTSLLTL